jgi:spore coat polysaccharide biosynthesis predicted glycosyltransferase SpsG
MNVVFHVAAGPRIGFGHLVRCRSLARALGVPPVVCIRGSATTRARAASSGWTVVSASELWKSRPTVVVVDDPSASRSAAILRRARQSRCATVTIHDASSSRGLVGDIAVDVSANALLDPSIAIAQCWRVRPAPRRVLIALGGGSHVFALAGSICRALAGYRTDLDVVVAAGFARRSERPELINGRWVDAPDGLVCELSKASVAVVAGGVTLYEACALGVPSVAVAVVAGQRPAIRRLSRQGAVVAAPVGRIADRVEQLLGDRGARRRLSAAARRSVDGRGVFRVADRIRRLHAA